MTIEESNAYQAALVAARADHEREVVDAVESGNVKKVVAQAEEVAQLPLRVAVEHLVRLRDWRAGLVAEAAPMEAAAGDRAEEIGRLHDVHANTRAEGWQVATTLEKRYEQVPHGERETRSAARQAWRDAVDVQQRRTVDAERAWFDAIKAHQDASEPLVDLQRQLATLDNQIGSAVNRVRHLVGLPEDKRAA